MEEQPQWAQDLRRHHYPEMTMNPPEPTTPNATRIVGTAGFMPLDIVELLRGEPLLHLFAGGTAGNVAAIMGAFRWESYPLARWPADDPVTQILVCDLQRFGVRTDFLHLDPPAPLPLLVQRKRADGSDRPTFDTRCRGCGTRFRGWSPIVNKTATRIYENGLPAFHCFLIDRFTRGNIALATHVKKSGALVVFEPTSLKTKERAEVTRFREALALADIVKYSHERFSNLSDEDFPRSPALEIQTCGEEGLRFRRPGAQGGAQAVWMELPPVAIPDSIDSCGAGDWVTATLLHLLESEEIDLHDCTEDQLIEVLKAAQAAGSWTCRYSGARGGMYADPDGLRDFVFQQTGRDFPLTMPAVGPPETRSVELTEAMKEFCPLCRGDLVPPPPAIPSGSQYGSWQDAGRPSYAGRKGRALAAASTREHGPGNWRLVYDWEGGTITREEALQIYVDAYVAYFEQNSEDLEWVLASASNVYDIDPSDVESGTDFTIQKQSATHLQDIAVRIAVERLEKKFAGKRLIRIRGKDSEGARLSPGVVPFHRPDQIVQPELEGWWDPGSLESFWQSNKRLEVRPWKSRLFVFGGSFDPIHNGHLDLARIARDRWGYDRVLFVPNGDNYSKKTLTTPAFRRLEMVEAAIEGEEGMEALDVEVRDPMKIRTPVTMRELRERYPESQLVLFRGLDSLHQTHRHCFELPNLMVLVVKRPGFEPSFEQVLARWRKFDSVRDGLCYLDEEVVGDLSSTKVRTALAKGKPIDNLVPPAVERLIRRNGHYSPR